MKKRSCLRLTIALLLLLVLLTFAACKQTEDPAHTGTLPDTIETVPGNDEDTEPETDAETTPTVSSVNFPAAQLPDYEKYATATRIKEVLGSHKTYAVTAGGQKYYVNGELKTGGDSIVTKNVDGTVTLDAAKLGGTACPVMNGANEAAVALFLEDEIGFYDIYDLVKGAMDAIPFIADPTLEQVLQCDAAARKYVAEHA